MKKGFTLIELLAVIVILGVLAAIVIPPAMKNIDNSRQSAYDQLIRTIEQTTQLYIRDKKDSISGINTVGNIITIDLQDLVDEEDLKTPVIDPRSEKRISLATQVSILVKAHGKYTVTVGTLVYID